MVFIQFEKKYEIALEFNDPSGCIRFLRDCFDAWVLFPKRNQKFGKLFRVKGHGSPVCELKTAKR